jgi:phosphohistidine phosphatase
MELLLWRHAEAEPGFPDIGRRLTTRGEQQAERMAGWLREHAPKDLRIIVSPAQRTLQTVAPFSTKYEVLEAVSTDGDADSLLKAADWPDAAGSVLVVGHQPTLGVVASRLLTGMDDDIAVKKGALWWFSSRVRDGHREMTLKAVIPPSLA